MNRERCPNCGKLLVDPFGNQSSAYLIAGEFPGYEELRMGTPFCGKAGEILQAELARAGLSVANFRITNLWLHAMNEKECDMAWHLDHLTKEMKGKKAVLLMGSELSKVFFHRGIMEMSGLEVKNEAFPKTRFMMSPNPALLFHGPVGEFRLAVSRFAEMM